MWVDVCVRNVLAGFQDSIDLFLGNYTVDDTDGPTPLQVQKDWKFMMVSGSSVCVCVCVCVCARSL